MVPLVFHRIRYALLPFETGCDEVANLLLRALFQTMRNNDCEHEILFTNIIERFDGCSHGLALIDCPLYHIIIGTSFTEIDFQ